MRQLGIMAVGLVLVLGPLLLGACGGGKAAQGGGGKAAQVGDVVSDGTWEVRVNQVRWEKTLRSSLPVGGNTFTAKEGFQFLVVEAEVRNIVDDELLFSTDSLYFVRQPDVAVFKADLVSMGPSGWQEGNIERSHPGGERDKTQWHEVEMALAVKKTEAPALFLRFRELEPIDLGLQQIR
jgi:hypothetical protein